jgi:hypothetical protein
MATQNDNGLANLIAVLGVVALLNSGGGSGFNSKRTTVKEPIPKIIRGYGTDRIWGRTMLEEAVNPYYSRVRAVCVDRTLGPRQWFLNEDRVVLDNGGFVQTVKGVGYEDNRITFAYRLGTTSQVAYGNPPGNFGGYWSPACRGDGISSFACEFKAGEADDFNGQFPYGLTDPSAAWDLLACYDWRDTTQSRTDPSTWKWTANNLVAMVNEMWRYHGYDWDHCFAPTLASLTAAANVCDGTVPVKNVLALVTDHEMVGKGATVIHLSSCNGLRAGTQITIEPGTDWEETATVASVETTPTYFPYARMERYAVHLSSALAQDHWCFRIVKWQSDPANPAVVPRYTFNYAFQEGEDLATIQAVFLESMGGWMSRTGTGGIIIKPFLYEEPDTVWTDRDVIGWDWKTNIGRERAANELKLSVVIPELDYRSVETDAWRDTADIERRGRSLHQSFAPKGVQCDNQVKRLAKLKMFQYQRPEQTITTRLSRIKDKEKRFIRIAVTDPRAPFLSNVDIEICGTPQLAENGLGIVWPVREVRSTDGAFDPATEEGAGPTVMNRSGGVV